MQVHYVSPRFACMFLLANPVFSRSFLMGGDGRMIEVGGGGEGAAREAILKRQNNNNNNGATVQVTDIIPQANQVNANNNGGNGNQQLPSLIVTSITPNGGGAPTLMITSVGGPSVNGNQQSVYTATIYPNGQTQISGNVNVNTQTSGNGGGNTGGIGNGNGNGNGNGGGAPPTNNGCTAEENRLGQGIQSNIAIQMMELEKVNAIGETLNANPVDGNKYLQEQRSLLETVQQGVTIREQNQAIAGPINSPASEGLAKVANAQKEELQLTQNLALQNSTGPAKMIVTTLQADFRGGIEQNMRNLMAATQKCAGSFPTNSTSGAQPAASGAGEGPRPTRRSVRMV
ncbi:hypothetical protein HYALB_00008867 [Hymenoscyphus albidus]|uniref:Uncharacterized protein n=1 Tax=Hymenoscyphus albidus TaxID=595503 RepID=A0A9N9Q6J4_9HELO|nr:hypothetical protein HYALB_00008867 [Hymenoscyphus albidus]